MATKTALITGANKGIGLEIALQLGARGFHVIASGRNEERVRGAIEQLQSRNVDAESLLMDVSALESIQEAFKKLSEKTESLDVLINNAGILLDEGTPLLEISEEDLLSTFRTNAFGAFFVVQTFLPLLRRGSRVINVSSSAGQVFDGVTTWAPVYSMSKTMLNVITMHLAGALRPRGIAVNAVCPGWVRTDMGGSGASRSLAKGAETAVWLATEADIKLTGKFLKDRKEIDW